MSDPFICTAETPWSYGQNAPGQQVQHRDAVEGEQIDGWPGGDMVSLYCPNCGLRWMKELPQ